LSHNNNTQVRVSLSNWMYIINMCVCVWCLYVSWSFIEPIHEVSRLRVGRSQFLKLPPVERHTCTMSFSDHETQRDASIVAVLCHFLFVSSVYIHTKTASFARLLSIERRRTSGRLSLASLRFILIEYKKKRTRKYLIYT
jgi:hypothetical protein